MADLLFRNILVLAFICVPIVLFEASCSRSAWMKRKHGMLAVAVWLLTLLVAYIWILPILGLKPNLRFFDQ